MKLLSHPASPPCAIEAIEVSAAIVRGASTLVYRVYGARPAMPAPSAPVRTDELWTRTCFELFVRPARGEGYYEFNFSPSTAWAAYRFDAYRAGMAEQPLAAPAIEVLADGGRVGVDLSGLPAGDWQVGIAAVIEEADGTKSYWALAHPGEKPDFHDGRGFTLSVPGSS